jgi:hypothetical protein
MASRSSAGIGVGITITLLGVLSLALFITTIVFLSKYNAAQRQLTQNLAEREDYITQQELQSDAIQRYKDAAKKGGRRSVVGFLDKSLRDTMASASGSPNDSYDQLTEKLKAIPGAESNNLIAVVRDRDAKVTDLNTKLEQSNKERQTALADLANEVERVKQINAAHQKTVDTMNADIDRYKAEVETYRNQTNDAKTFMEKRVQEEIEKRAQSESALNEKNRNLESENLNLKDQLSKLREGNKRNILQPKSEMALVDGEVVGLNQAANTVVISRGARDKVILGMTFGVYSDAAAINVDAGGNYPRPKATLEVINVGDTSSTCRITAETKGNPVIRGDVIANALYDPNKVYTFLVYGNFDANGDGTATPAEADDIKAMITAWNGKVTDTLSGNVDFLVLGERPQLPPPPSADAPTPVVNNYMHMRDLAQKYDRLLEQAASTSLPILNQNRLFTLIGRRPGAR